MIEPIPSCHLCGANHWKLFKSFGEYRLLKCRDCALIVLHPQPSADQLQNLYDQRYFSEHLPMHLPDEKEIDSEVKKRFFFVNWLEYTTQINGGKLLEVGCATGLLLKAFETRGWQTAGIEISQSASEFARTKLGLNVKTGMVSSETVGSDSFDAIVMIHTFEHFPNPLQALQLLRENLAKTGFLIIQLPNVASLEARIKGKTWQGWRIPYHLFHYTPRTLHKVLQKCGYRIVSREYSLPTFEKKILDHFKSSEKQTPASVPPLAASTIPHSSLRKKLLHLNKQFPIGRDMTVVAVRNDHL